MLLESVKLTNFSVYRGTHCLDLSVDPERPRRNIVLIGGRNGCGKTSLLEAIRVCFYGPQVLDGIAERRTYDDYIRARVNRNAFDDKNVESSVRVEFSYTLRGRESKFSVERCWTVVDGDVKETLKVVRDGVPLRDIEMDHWQQFLNELIPPGVIQFFFFDAEQIQSLAQDGDPGAYLVEAINALLDIDILDRLEGDLNVLSKRLLHETGGNEPKSIQDTARAVDEQNAKINIIKDQIAALQAKERELLGDRTQVEKTLHKQGVILGLDRKKLQQEVGTLHEAVRRASADLQELYASALPLGMIPQLVSATKRQLEAERRRKTWEASRAFADGHAKSIWNHVEQHAILQRLQHSERDALRAQYLQHWDGVLQQPPDAATRSFLGMSDLDEERVLQQFATLPKLIADFKALVETKTRAEARLAQVRAQLAKAPEGSPLQTLLQKLSELDRGLGAAQADQVRLRESLVDAEKKLKPLVAAHLDAMKSEEAHSLVARKHQLIDKVHNVIDGFRQGILTKKAKQLEGHISEMIARLARKQDLVRGLKLNAKTYEVTLIGRYGRTIPKQQLSAGEKQIYAIAMLWGLAQTSGRQLPIIIDTPLGRLDSVHRKTIVEQYFPAASHQVIVLSTDTEIDEKHYASIEKNVARAFHLEYQGDDEGTHVEQDYFWQSTQEAG